VALPQGGDAHLQLRPGGRGERRRQGRAALPPQGFIGTIPPLIQALDAVRDTLHCTALHCTALQVKDTVNKQRKITQAFGEAFDQCETCG
jgi:hypothetical protein